MKIQKLYIFPFIFFSVLVLGICLSLVGFDFEIELTGETISTEKPVASINAILTGEFQSQTENYFDENYPLKDIGILTKNTLLLNFFNISPNEYIVVGKNENLFEQAYIDDYCLTNGIYFGETNRETIERNVQDLLYIQDQLKKADRDCYVLITPSKATFYPEDIPLRYTLNMPPQEELSNYDVLIETLKKYKINYYDSVQYFKKNSIPISIFPKTGTHWRIAAADYAFGDFFEIFNETSINKLPNYSIGEPLKQDISVADAVDTDIYRLMNTYRPISDVKFLDDSYFKRNMKESVYEEYKKVSISIQGSSFGYPLYYLMDSKFIERVIFIDKNNYFDSRTGHSIINDYKQFNMDEYLQSNIFIFEVNQLQSHSMSSGYISALKEYIKINGIPNIPNIPNWYTIGDSLHFIAENNRGKNYLTGISYTEELGTWSSGKNSTLKLNFEPTKSDLVVQIELANVLFGKQNIQISSISESGNNVELFNELVTGSFSFDISNELVKDGNLILSFEYKNAISPNSAEDRVLSIFFSEIKVIEKE